MPTTHDVIVIGGGAAGYTAAMFTARERLRTVVVERFASGGQVLNCEHIDNYPGFPDGIAGYTLGPALQQQADAAGAEVRMSEVAAVRREGEEIVVETDGEPLRSRVLIVASGSRFATLNVPGEEEFVGKGISHCASCDGSFFMNQPVAVVGGGDAAVDEATHLTQYASQVTVIHRRDTLRRPRSRSAPAPTARSASAGTRRCAPSTARRACSVCSWRTSPPARASR